MPHSRRVWRDNGLSIVLVVSFLATWLEQVLAGWDVYNDERRDAGRHAVSITECWSVISARRHSRTGRASSCKWPPTCCSPSSSVSVARLNRDARVRSSWWTSMLAMLTDEVPAVRRGGLLLILYENSLSLAFAAIFIASFWLRAERRAPIQRAAAGAGACARRHARLRRHVAVLVRVVPELAERVSVPVCHGRAVDLPAPARVA